MSRDLPLVVRWRAALRDSDLPPRDKLVGFVLACYWTSDGSCAPWGKVAAPGAGPSMETLGKGASMFPSAVRGALRRLEKAGYLHVTHKGRGRGNTNRWIAAFPGEPVEASRTAGRLDDLN